jgi:diguanylate cyclase (GGDEF)-like protein
MPVLYRNIERESFTLYSKPYYRGKLGILVNTDSTVSREDLTQVKVGMQKNNGSILIVKQQIPDINLIEITNNVELVKSLATKKVAAIIGNPIMFFYHAKEEQINNIKLLDYINMDKAEQLDTSLNIGIRKDWPVLHQILIKAMENITDDEFANIEKKWTSIKIINPIDWKLIGQIFVLIIVIVLFLLWNNKKLKMMVDIKARELKKLNEELELKVKLRTKDLLALNVELERIAHTDPLTGAYNRRYFFDVAKQCIELAKREKHSISIVMIDIDKFKKINDSFGHDTGDNVIKCLVDEVSGIIRASDVFSRFGGEEFILLFPNTELHGALITSEKIRKTIANCSKIDKISFTISLGVSEYNESENDINDVIKRADKALYNAKRNGRNRIEYI